jgi:hypothetical protein
MAERVGFVPDEPASLNDLTQGRDADLEARRDVFARLVARFVRAYRPSPQLGRIGIRHAHSRS